MSHLNHRAFEILRTELQKCTGNDSLSQGEQSLVLRELELLQKAQGSPASLEELRQLILILYPNFSEKVLQTAAKANANQPVGGCCLITSAAVVLVLGTGVLVLASLLNPINRQSVVQNVPVASNSTRPLTAEEHYTEAMALVEQVEQLTNQAKTSADVVLAEKKLNAAKQHLDELPQWRTVSVPQYTWRQKKSGRRVRRLVNVQQQKVTDERFQNVLSRFEQATTQLSYKKQTYGRTQTLIVAAKQYALSAAKLGQHPPHTADQWQQVVNLWQEAIDQLQSIGVEDVGYVEAQKLLATYRTNSAVVQTRRQTERESQQIFEGAQANIQTLIASVSSQSTSVDQLSLITQIQEIINQLKTIQPGTTAYPEAQYLLQSAQKKLKQLQVTEQSSVHFLSRRD